MANQTGTTVQSGTDKKTRKKPVRGTPQERFAKAIFAQLRPAMSMAKERLDSGETPPASVVQAAGDLTAAIVAWSDNHNG